MKSDVINASIFDGTGTTSLLVTNICAGGEPTGPTPSKAVLRGYGTSHGKRNSRLSDGGRLCRSLRRTNLFDPENVLVLLPGIWKKPEEMEGWIPAVEDIQTTEQVSSVNMTNR